MLPKVLANFETSLASKISATATTGTLNTSADADNTTLSGDYILTIDEGQSTEEHVLATLSGASITAMTRGLSRVDSTTSKTSSPDNRKEHGRGASVKITNMNLILINRLINADDEFDADNIMKYDAEPSFTSASNELATVKFAEDQANAGAADASTVQKGLVEEATQAEIEAGTGAGSTSARLAVNPSTLAPALQKGAFTFAVDAEASDTYVIALTPALTAYTTGQRFTFTANTANTGACTLNVNALGAKTIKKFNDQDLETGDIEAGQVVEVVYDGTNLQMQTPLASNLTTATAVEAEAFFTATDISGAEAETLTDTSNADLLHSHSIIPEQVLPYVVSTTTAYASNVNFATNSDYSIGVITYYSSGNYYLHRVAREQGQYVLTHTASYSGTSIAEISSMILSDYIYVEYDDNGTNKIDRYDLADLANVTSITISGTGWSAGGSSFTDGTDLYVYTAADTFRRYTISGTTATHVAAITYTTAGAINNGSATCDGTSVWVTENASGAITIRKYALAGGAATATVIRYFYPDAQPNHSKIGLFLPYETSLGVAYGFTVESNVGVEGSSIRLLAITRT